MGPDGLLVLDAETDTHIPSYHAEGLIDIVGAGDSVTAGTVAALCVGATLAEAALIGNLAASITIQQIGVTGTASPHQSAEPPGPEAANRPVLPLDPPSPV